MRAYNPFRPLAFGALAVIVFASCASTLSQQRFDYYEPTLATDESIRYPVPNRCAADLPTRADGVTLDAPHIVQEVPYVPFWESNLCWATTIAMVSTYLGNPRSPCQIASYIANDGMSCCRLSPSSPKDAIARCNQGAYTSQITDTMHRMGIYQLHLDGPLDEDRLRNQLSNGRPVILEMTYKVKEGDKDVPKGHVVVIAGYKNGQYLVLNPNRRSSDMLTYDQLLHGENTFKWTWSATWHHFSYRPDGCNPRFNTHCDCDP